MALGRALPLILLGAVGILATIYPANNPWMLAYYVVGLAVLTIWAIGESVGRDRETRANMRELKAMVERLLRRDYAQTPNPDPAVLAGTARLPTPFLTAALKQVGVSAETVENLWRSDVAAALTIKPGTIAAPSRPPPGR